jgi:CxxC motif-containing protein
MIKNFNKYLNEYSGPGKAIGFRYSKPTSEFTIQCVCEISDDLDIDEFMSAVKIILTDMDIEKFETEMIPIKNPIAVDNKANYVLSIDVVCYSEGEAVSIGNELNRNLLKIYILKYKSTEIGIL